MLITRLVGSAIVCLLMTCSVVAQAFDPLPDSQPAAFFPPLIVGAPAAGVADDMAVGDWNNDGVADLVLAHSAANSITIIIGSPAGPPAGGFVGTAIAVGALTGGATPISVTAGDYDNDGDQDIAVLFAGSFGPIVSGSQVSILANNGAGVFGVLATFPISPTLLPAGRQAMASGDVNGDGIPDLAIANTTGVSLALSAGGTTVPAPGAVLPVVNAIPDTFGVPVAPESVILSDMDNSGQLDLVMCVNNQVAIANGRVQIFGGNGVGGFPVVLGDVQVAAASVFVEGCEVADVAGDGTQDVIVSSTIGAHVVENLNPTGVLFVNSFDLNSPYPSGGGRRVKALDIDGDGGTDIALAVAGGQFEIWRNSGTTVFTNEATFGSAGTGTRDAILSDAQDFDFDGDLDFLVVNDLGQVDAVLNNTNRSAYTRSFESACGPLANLITLSVSNPVVNAPITLSVFNGIPLGACGGGTTLSFPVDIVITAPRANNIPDTPFVNAACLVWTETVGTPVSVISLMTDASGNASITLPASLFPSSLVNTQLMVQAFIDRRPCGGNGFTGVGFDITNAIGVNFGAQ